MKNDDDFERQESAPLSPEWLGLLGVASSVGSGAPLDDDTVARIKTQLMSRIRAASAQAAPPPHRIVLKDAQWQVITQKIQVKVLRNDGDTMSWLLKLMPDTALPAHPHTDCDEECLVMDGSVRIDGELLRAGDYTVAARGTEHHSVYSEAGCTLYLRSPASHEAQLALLCEA
jgi:anti-sigma factor ChrR (cupin superfamily)